MSLPAWAAETMRLRVDDYQIDAELIPHTHKITAQAKVKFTALEDLNIATFLDCWSPKCYATAYQYWIVAFNTADSAEKTGQSELAQATQYLAELENVAADAETKRRDWVLKELKTQDCCGPLSGCP